MNRPVLRYHGAKWRIAPWIIDRLPRHRTYVEPFGGGAGVLLRKPRSVAEIYNDVDEDVVNVFRVLRDPAAAKKLRRACELTPFARCEHRISYEPASDVIERARRTIFRSFASHSGTSRRRHRSGFRAKALRRSNCGAADWRGWPSEIPTFVERMRGVIIECRDALEVIAQQDAPTTLFYCDPPYPLSTRTSIRNPCDVGRAYAQELTDEDHVALAAALHQVRGMVLVSGYHCDLLDGLYDGWVFEDRDVFADRAAPRTEVLWFNPEARASLAGVLF